MKTLIYQCWDGEERKGNLAGVKLMKDYADKIGAEHIYEHNPQFRTDLGSYSPNYGKFKPVYEHGDYDYVMYADCDVVPRDNCTENIFEMFDDEMVEIGICEEPNAPLARSKYTIGGGINNANDERWVELVEKKWPVKMPRTSSGLPKVYNSGMILWSKTGMEKAREDFFDFGKYVKLMNAFNMPAFYTCDQPYIHAMLEVCDFNWKTIPYKWNSSVHYDPGNKTAPRPVIDLRKDNCNFVHIQLNGADNWSEDKIHRVVNLPVSEWQI